MKKQTKTPKELSDAINSLIALFEDKSITGVYIDRQFITRTLDVLYEAEDDIHADIERQREEEELRRIK